MKLTKRCAVFLEQLDKLNKIEYRYGYKFGTKQQNVIENDDVKRTNGSIVGWMYA